MPNFTPNSSKGYVEKLSKGSQAILRELVTDAPLEGSNLCLLEKPKFLFGDEVTVPDEALYVFEYKWLRKVGGVQTFLPDIARSYSLAYLQKLSVSWSMGWNMTRE